MSFFRSTKPEARPLSDGRPLLRAATPSTSSIATSKFDGVSSRPSEDVTSFRPDSKMSALETQEKQKEETAQPPFVRPTTPPKGSNYTAWSSYRDLPLDHPVFRYPDEMREKMYSKGVGQPSSSCRPRL
jgi:hypothetical protein